MNWDKLGRVELERFIRAPSFISDMNDRLKELDHIDMPGLHFDFDLGHILIRQVSVEDQVIRKLDNSAVIERRKERIIERSLRVKTALIKLESYNKRYWSCVNLLHLERPKATQVELANRLGCGYSVFKLRRLERKSLSVLHYFIKKEKERSLMVAVTEAEGGDEDSERGCSDRTH